MNAALRAPANLISKITKVPVRVILGAPLIKDPAAARRLVDSLHAFKTISKKPNAIKALAKAAAVDPQEKLKYVVNQYARLRNSTCLVK